MEESSICRSICVIGAGTVGLSQALRILECEGELGGNVRVTIIAEKVLAETTSYGSGGLWEPYQILGTPDEKVNAWGRLSFDHFLHLLHSSEAGKAGVQLLTAYNLQEAHEAEVDPSWKDIVFNFRRLGSGELGQMGLPPRFTHGFTFATLVVEQRLYMAHLTARLEALGDKVVFVRQRIDSLDAFLEQRGAEYDAVINCTGLGAAALLGAPGDVYPIRGQVLRVTAPWFNNVFFWGSSYIIPNVDSVVLGGTAQRGDWDTTPREADTQKILQDVCELFPAFREAPLQNVWAGLRPGRTPLRLESEVRAGTLVVHNYGHGGSGITLAYGCADDVLRNHLVPEFTAEHTQPRQYSMSEWVRYKSRL